MTATLTAGDVRDTFTPLDTESQEATMEDSDAINYCHELIMAGGELTICGRPREGIMVSIYPRMITCPECLS